MTVADDTWKDDAIFGGLPAGPTARTAREAPVAGGPSWVPEGPPTPGGPAPPAVAEDWTLLAGQTTSNTGTADVTAWRTAQDPDAHSLEDIFKTEVPIPAQSPAHRDNGSMDSKATSWQREIHFSQQHHTPGSQPPHQQQLHHQQQHLPQQEQQYQEQRMRHPSEHETLPTHAHPLGFPSSADPRYSTYSATSRSPAPTSYTSAFSEQSFAPLPMPYAPRDAAPELRRAHEVPSQAPQSSAISEETTGEAGTAPQSSDVSSTYRQLSEAPRMSELQRRLSGPQPHPQRHFSEHQFYTRLGDPQLIPEPLRHVRESQRLQHSPQQAESQRCVAESPRAFIDPQRGLSDPQRGLSDPNPGLSDTQRGFADPLRHVASAREHASRDLQTPPEFPKWRPPEQLQELAPVSRPEVYYRAGTLPPAPLRPTAQLPTFPPNHTVPSQRQDSYASAAIHPEQHFTTRPRIDHQASTSTSAALHLGAASRPDLYPPAGRLGLPYRPEPQRSDLYPTSRAELPYPADAPYILPDTWSDLALSRGARHDSAAGEGGVRASPRPPQQQEPYMPPPAAYQLSPGQERGVRGSPRLQLPAEHVLMPVPMTGWSGAMLGGGGPESLARAGGRRAAVSPAGMPRPPLDAGAGRLSELTHTRTAADSTVASPSAVTSPPTRCASSEDGASLPSPRNDDEGPVTCRYCATPTTFDSVASLAEHMPLRHGDRPFLCRWCLKAFKLGHHLKDHRRIHTGEKPFQCRICSKSFTRHSILKAHAKVHKK